MASVEPVILTDDPLQTIAGELINAVGTGLTVTTTAAEALLIQLDVLVANK